MSAELLGQVLLPIDDLVTKKYRVELAHVQRKYARPHPHYASAVFKNMITLKLIQDEKVRAASRDYVYRLLQDEERLGYLYHLSKQKMVVQLDVRFNGELVIEPGEHYDDVVKAIDDVAREFACSDTPMFQITRVELLYFYTMLMNPHLNWVTVDHLLRCQRNHDHLIAAPSRLNPKRVGMDGRLC